MNSVIQIIQSISILVGIWVGIATLSIWRQEFVSKRRIELAEDWLASAYSFRDAISNIRNPLSSTAESASRPKTEAEKNDSPEIANAKDRGYIFYARYNSGKENITNFFKLKYTTMARFGKSAENIYLEANKLWNDLTWGANIMAEHWYDAVTLPNRVMDSSEQQLISEASSLIFGKSKNDKVSEKMNEIISKIETEVKLITEERFGLADLLNRPVFKKKNGKTSEH